MKQSSFTDALLFLLASPVLFVVFVYRFWKHLEFLRAASVPSFACECGRAVSLVGMWRCSCGFTYRGHLLRVCPVCKRLPSMVRCYGCGVTTKLPEPLHGTGN